MAILPDNGASMFDAARTRENDGGCCCEECDLDSDTCGKDLLECENELAAESAEAAWEGAREARE